MTLQQNTDHIQTTHIGSLPRPHNTNPHAQRLSLRGEGHPCPRPRHAALPEKRSRVRSSRALSVGDEDLFRIDCSALLFQPVSEGVVALQDVTGRQSVFEQQRVR